MTYDLLSLMCNVSNRVVFSSSSVLCFTKRNKGKDFVDYIKDKYREENVLEFVRSVPRNLNALLRGFMRIRVE